MYKKIIKHMAQFVPNIIWDMDIVVIQMNKIKKEEVDSPLAIRYHPEWMDYASSPELQKPYVYAHSIHVRFSYKTGLIPLCSNVIT